MARKSGVLTALAVSRAKAPGYYGDGGGLYLQVSEAGTKSWIFRFRLHGKRRETGLGSLDAVSLSQARQKAGEARGLVANGIDPIEAKRASRAIQEAAKAGALTFRDAAGAYIKSHEAGWRNPKHRQQWPNTLEAYAYPKMGKVAVGEVEVSHVMKVLEPIWTEKPETASRVRGRIEAILDWAVARGFRKGDNPARWRGHLANLLPASAKVRRVEHHPALPYAEIGEFMAALRKQEGVAPQAFEFAILTAARTSEVIGATWNEIDLKAGVWIIPGSRIKAGRDHRVPLSPRALEILEAMKGVRESDFVFPGGRKGRPLSGMAFLMTLRRMKRTGLTAHGFRSTFRDWAAEQTNYAREVAEMSLAHAIGDKVEAAYRRGDLFEKRRQLMTEWAKFCSVVPKAQKTANVVLMRARR